MRRTRFSSWLLAGTLAFVLGPAQLTAEEECLKNAWGRLSAKDYDAAIEAADVCIDDFAQEAYRQEAKLQQQRVPPLSPSDANKSKIFKQGILNDVPAAYVVKGRAAEALTHKRLMSSSEKAAFKRMAIEAYVAAAFYKHAWVWDPGPPSAEGHGWFWSPSGVAADRLTKLRDEEGTGHSR